MLIYTRMDVRESDNYETTHNLSNCNCHYSNGGLPGDSDAGV